MADQKVTIGATDVLVVVDMQNDFCFESGRLYVSGVPGEATTKEVIANTLHLTTLPFCRRIASLDVHPASGHVEFGIYGPHCVNGTSGAQLIDELDGACGHHFYYMIKGDEPSIVSYSIATSKEYPELITRMRILGIKRIFLCGVAYTHCVGESAIAFASQLFETYVVRDATRSVPPPYGDPEKMAQKLALYGVKEVTMADLV